MATKKDEARNKMQRIIVELTVVDRHLRALKDKTEELENKKEQLINELQKAYEDALNEKEA